MQKVKLAESLGDSRPTSVVIIVKGSLSRGLAIFFARETSGFCDSAEATVKGSVDDGNNNNNNRPDCHHRG